MSHILAAVDLSSVSAAVIREAEFFARAMQARLTLLHVAGPNPEEFVGYEAGPQAGPQAVRDSRAEKLRHEHTELQQRAAALRASGIEADALLVEGPTVETILKEADRFESRLIVLGTHGHGMLFHALVGSTGAGVVKESKRPVLIVPDPRRGQVDAS
jgi:nucleotide-binding universal stress UspA family protein